jgi:hypothetical protein
VGGYAPRALEDIVRSRRMLGASGRPSTSPLGFVLRLSKVDVVFLCTAITILAGILWSFVNSPQQVGPDRHGTVGICTPRLLRTTYPRVCTVQLSDDTTVTVYGQTRSTHDRVLVTEMRYRVSQRVYYTAVHRDEP